MIMIAQANDALKNAGIVVDHPATLVTLGDMSQGGVLLACLGFFVIAALAYLRAGAHVQVDRDRLALIGHSGGGAAAGAVCAVTATAPRLVSRRAAVGLRHRCGRCGRRRAGCPRRSCRGFPPTAGRTSSRTVAAGRRKAS
mgnify:CR=1 FL=1